MSFFNFLKPSPFIEEIKDKDVIKKKYFYWRLRTFYAMYIGYAFFYVSRTAFTFVQPGVAHEFGFSKPQIGLLGSVFTITYGFSKFLNGIISDKSNSRYFMGIGLILTGIFNIFLGCSSSLLFFAIFFGLNAWFQGYGWPPCAKLLTHWYSQSERGSWWSSWNTSHNLGAAFIPLIIALIIKHYGWRYAMYIPSTACILIGLFLINRLRDSPQSLGLPSVEKYRKEPFSKKSIDVQEKLSAKDILFKYVLSNKYIWILSLASFFIYFLRFAFTQWGMFFLPEVKGYSFGKAALALCFFESGGFLGSLAAGWSSDLIFKGKRGPVNAIFAFLILVTVFLLWKSPGGYWLIDSVLIFFSGFFIFGPQMLIGVAAAELSHKKAAGTSTGFAGIFAYAGSTAAGFFLGKIIHVWGWEGFFITLCICGILAVLFLGSLWNIKNENRSH